MTEHNEPMRALSEVLESLVLSYSHELPTSRFWLTTDFWDKPLEAKRSFIEFEFAGVSVFIRKPGNRPEVQQYVESFRAGNARGTYVLQEVHVSRRAERYLLTISLGLNFGGFSFSFERVVARQLDTTVTRTGEASWSYFELETGEPLDFFDPFGRGD